MRLQRIPPPSPAERLFLALLGAPAPPATAPASETFFWSRLLELALCHGLAGYLHLRRDDGAWYRTSPPWFRERLREQAAGNAMRHELFLAELRRLGTALAAHGVRPVLLKGPALNLLVYRDPAERAYGDLDLLVDPRLVPAASLVLSDRGYLVDQERLPEEFYRRHHFHLVFRHRELAWARVEIHWDLAVPAMDTGFGGREVRERARPLQAAGLDLLVPAPEDFLLHLCLHAATGAFSRLSQIRDVHAAAAHPGWRIEPAVFWERARQARLQAPAAACLELARLFGPDPAVAALRAAGPPATSRGLAGLLRPVSVVRQRLLASAAGGLAVTFERRDRRRDRLAVLGRRLRQLAAELGMDGHPYPAGDGDRGRLFSWRGVSHCARALAYSALGRCGWEIPPVRLLSATRPAAPPPARAAGDAAEAPASRSGRREA